MRITARGLNRAMLSLQLLHAPTQAPGSFGSRPSYVAAPWSSGPASRRQKSPSPATSSGSRGPPGGLLYDVLGAPRPPEDTPAPPRLMAMRNSTLLASFDRSRIIPPDSRKLVIRSNEDVLPTLLVDGYVAGVWRPREEGIEAASFHSLPDDAWEGIAAESRSLVAFLGDREPTIYRRYDYWWRTLPSAETRILPGSVGQVGG